MVRFKPVPFPSYPLLCSILPSQCTISGKHYSPFTYNKDFWDLSQYCLSIFDWSSSFLIFFQVFLPLPYTVLLLFPPLHTLWCVYHSYISKINTRSILLIGLHLLLPERMIILIFQLQLHQSRIIMQNRSRIIFSIFRWPPSLFIVIDHQVQVLILILNFHVLIYHLRLISHLSWTIHMNILCL